MLLYFERNKKKYTQTERHNINSGLHYIIIKKNSAQEKKHIHRKETALGNGKYHDNYKIVVKICDADTLVQITKRTAK